jgi:gliding motility-associated-like protein
VLNVTFSFAQNDCSDALVVCGNSGFNGLSASGFGVQELVGHVTCEFAQENNSIWLKLNINTTGTLTFTIIPESTDIAEDFDFYVFGPNATCGNIGQTIRCSTTNPHDSNQSNNYTGLNLNETDTSEGAGSNGNSFLRYMDVQSGETYFLVIDRPPLMGNIVNNNFSIVWGGTATLNEAPTFQIPSGTAINIKNCDTDLVQDYSTSFDLTQNDSQIIGTQTGVAVSYYLDSNDAVTGNNPILTPNNFINTTNPQAVFARITNTTTLCYNTLEFSIEVDNPISFPNDTSSVCDDATDGNDSNGKSTFDLNKVTLDIFGTQDISDLTIHYYLSQNDALLNSNPFGQFFNNTVPNQQSIFIKAVNSNGCYGIKEIHLQVIPVPVSTTFDLIQCDAGFQPDGFTLFNLNEATPSFLNNNPNLILSYYKDSNEVAANIPLNPNYTNISNPQTLLVKITNTVTGCSSLSTLILKVNVIPSQQISIAPKCDIINQENGFNSFDLSTAAITLTATQSAKFYPTLNDALLEQNQIVTLTNYTNPIAYNSSVFVRIEDGNNCSGISEIPLIVTKLPNIETLNDGNFYVCNNIPSRFVTIDAGILTGVPSDYSYKWYFNGNLIPKTSYSIQVNQSGDYTVDVLNAEGCSKTRTVIVTDSNQATIKDIQIESITDDENTVTILLANSIGNYEYSLNNENGPFQTSPIFENVSAGFHTIYVNDSNGCGIVNKMFAIIGFPHFFTPNGDGVNDSWKINGVDGVFNKETIVYIFDRFGKLVKEIVARETKGWDGTLNGSAMPADDYWFVVKLTNGNTAKGHFTLKR